MNWHDDMHVALLRKAYARDLDTLTIRQDAALQRYIRDVFAAGRTEGEKACHAKPVAIIQGGGFRRNRAVDLAIEILASASTLAGMWLGSTTLSGAECYLVAGIAWCAISWRKDLHGIWPLNVGALLVTASNLWAALS